MTVVTYKKIAVFLKKETGDKTQRRQLQVGWALGRPMSTFSPKQRIVFICREKAGDFFRLFIFRSVKCGDPSGES
ncbi:hypothetical protein BBR47_03810 [Brevibacillus brevis NBRC 100599]|uniref:Uncharacterized protein n=1 Tax=Brevibacillus brevis (strain 47 / JCM 6285 / NBRC 100599) TaxID=358681 RepID=C0ZIZ0_BREBN|nr:hypothetical protein BBR47_03810 [Brevibacillus brevis NBRC 100599]